MSNEKVTIDSIANDALSCLFGQNRNFQTKIDSLVQQKLGWTDEHLQTVLEEDGHEAEEVQYFRGQEDVTRQIFLNLTHESEVTMRAFRRIVADELSG